MNPILINEEKCIGCGLCVSDCVSSYLYLENGKAHASTAGCIECGHCYAICPQGAVTIAGYDCADEPVVPMTEIPSDTLLKAMGGNSQNVSYIILGSKQAEAEAIAVDLFRKGTSLPRRIEAFAKRLNISDDFFFKGAPLVILVTGSSKTDTGLASAYMEIMAESLGLGVLFSGFFVTCTKLSAKLRKLIKLPRGHKVRTCMIIGYPAVKYQRIVPRKALKAKTL